VSGCLVLLLSGAGCGGATSTGSTTEATVTGKVTIHGKPATKGQVVFDPTNIDRPDAGVRQAEIGPDGTYRATTLVGSNSVTVVVPRPAGPADGMAPELGLNAKAGDNTLDIALPYLPQ
jgi:hypothetical protein